MESSLKYCLREDLECPICLEMAQAPIYNCVNGHIICGKCFEKVKICGLCRQPMRPCWFAERLLKKHEVTFPCQNQSLGCTVAFKPTELNQHHLACQYRPIKCCNKKKTRCYGQEFNLNEFHGHLSAVHKCLRITFNKGTFCPIPNANAVNSNDGSYRVKSVKVILVDELDGTVLDIHEAIRDVSVYWWVTMVGAQEAAKRYKYTLTAYSNDKDDVNSETLKLTWTHPVLCLHDHQELTAALSSENFATMHWKSLSRNRKCEGGHVRCGGSWAIAWDFGIEIFKKEARSLEQHQKSTTGTQTDILEESTVFGISKKILFGIGLGVGLLSLIRAFWMEFDWNFYPFQNVEVPKAKTCWIF